MSVKKKSWPPEREPTAEEFIYWWNSHEEWDDRVAIIYELLEDSYQGYQCLLRNHSGMQDEILFLSRQAEKYRLAWKSARRRGDLRNRYFQAARAMMSRLYGDQAPGAGFIEPQSFKPVDGELLDVWELKPTANALPDAKDGEDDPG